LSERIRSAGCEQKIESWLKIGGRKFSSASNTIIEQKHFQLLFIKSRTWYAKVLVYVKEIAVGIFFAVSVAVKLATNYGKISRQGTATILLSKQINCIAIKY